METRERVTIPVSGMTCASCERRITRALLRLPGVESVSVSATRGRATVLGSPLPDRPHLEAAIRKAGYEPTGARWLSDDPSVWRTFVVSVVGVGVVAALLATVGTGGITSALTDPAQGGLLLVVVLGLAAGVSTCMAMVGGLVLGVSAAHAASLAAAGRTGVPLATRMRPQLAFNAGRVAGFAVLGALLGAVGSAMSLPTRVLAVLVLTVAAVMFLLGVRLTGISPRAAGWTPRLPQGLGRTLGITPGADQSYSTTRTALLGAGTFLLPCGFTQAVQLYALSTGSALQAGTIMAAFALGTTPGLLAVAAVPEVTSGQRQVTVLRAVGVVVLAFALLNLSGGLNLLGVRGGSATTATATASANVSVENGVQTVRMAQTPQGYEPATTVVYSGLPTKWVIDGTSPLDCSAYLRVPDLGVSVNLVEGPNTVDLPALQTGEVPFTCVMGMYSGTLVVVDPPPPATGAAS
ncbi:MAG TPA: sulfite exporter TauE/SafE family protein [Phycicoccus sp.]|nr:sulfite exporter TauE/SafE family protein [Phycicoccus sp.]